MLPPESNRSGGLPNGNGNLQLPGARFSLKKSRLRNEKHENTREI
jgi:hypothetical protein